MDTWALLGATVVCAGAGGMVWRAGLGLRFRLWLRMGLWTAVRLVPLGFPGAVPLLGMDVSRGYFRNVNLSNARIANFNRVSNNFFSGKAGGDSEPLRQREQAGRIDRRVAEHTPARVVGPWKFRSRQSQRFEGSSVA